MSSNKTLKIYYQLDYKNGINTDRRISLIFSTMEGARMVAKDLKKQVLDLELWECTESSPMIDRTRLPL